MITPSNPKVKEVVAKCEKEIKALTNGHAIVLLVFHAPEFPIEFETIVEIVCNAVDVPPKEALQHVRDEDNVLARHLIAFYARIYGKLTHKRISRYMGSDDHTRSVWSVKKIKDSLEAGDPVISAAVRKINRIIEQLNPAA